MGTDRTILLRQSPNSKTIKGYMAALRACRDELINIAGDYMAKGRFNESLNALNQAGVITHGLVLHQRRNRGDE